METPPEHKLIFLNELHEMLKQFNPRHVRSAGYFRILGQLLEYDIDCQMAKIGSLFHHEYTSGSIDLSFFTGDRKVEDRKSHNSRPEPKVQAQETKQVFGSTGYCPIEAASRVHSINGTNTNNNSSTTIDLTLDDDEEDQDVRKDLVINTPIYTHHYQDTSNAQGHIEASNNTFVDLTILTDDDDDDDDNGDSKQDHISKSHSNNSTTSVSTRPKLAPKVLLWVDMQLLEPMVFEPSMLFQFMGEVVYIYPSFSSSSINSVAGMASEYRRESQAISDRENIQRRGHWVLQAKTARSMEGLDLFSYRQAILMMRDLVRRQREKKQEDRKDNNE